MDQLALLPIDPVRSLTARPLAGYDKTEAGASDDRFRRIESVLGAPYYSGHGVTLFKWDCLEAMRQLPAGLVNLTVTSPPYNIGKAYETPRGLDDYLSWCAEWMHEIHRLTAQDGAFWLNLGYVPIPERGKAVPLPYML